MSNTDVKLAYRAVEMMLDQEQLDQLLSTQGYDSLNSLLADGEDARRLFIARLITRAMNATDA